MNRRTLLFSFVALLAMSGVLHACPMCKDSLANGDAQGLGALPNGFNTSIQIMLVGFLATVSLVGTIIWKALRS